MNQKPNYGLDAPAAVKKCALLGVIGISLTVMSYGYLPSHWGSYLLTTFLMSGSFSFLIPAVTITLGSLVFKFRDREWLFEHLQLKGPEQVLDVGCGHGLLTIGAAKRLTTGKALGLDLWVQEDQASNSMEATLQNTRVENVEDKVEIHSGDMRKMHFKDSTFDAVVSSWAIHNIYDKNEREKALREITRVLKPGGKLAILDIDHARSYLDFFRNIGFKDVQLLGPRYTFGNKTYLVLAEK